MDLTPLLAPIITALVGAIGIVMRDLYDRRSEMGRRKYVMDDAMRQITFAAEWWKAKQALGCSPDDESARSIAQSWLDEATSRVSDAWHPPRPPEPERSVIRRVFLAYPFQRWTAKVLRVTYYLLLVFTATGFIFFFQPSPGVELSDALGIGVMSMILYGLPALAVRAWAVSIESRAAMQRASAPSSTDGPTTGPPGWYPDPSGAARQRYWDGRQWTAVSDTPRLSDPARTSGAAGDESHSTPPTGD